LATIFRVGRFCSFLQENRLLLPRISNGFAERSLNLGFVSTARREKLASSVILLIADFFKPVTRISIEPFTAGRLLLPQGSIYFG
jgi:hypothetical protein